MAKGSTEWTPIYMLVVLAIAAVLLVTFIKPLFNQASSASQSNLGAASDLLHSAAFLAFCIPRAKRRE